MNCSTDSPGPAAHERRLLIVNSQTLHRHPDGWRGDGWHDFADAIASHFKSATLLAATRMDGGDHLDVWPLQHVAVRSVAYASFVEVAGAVLDRHARQTIWQIPGLIREHDLVLTRFPEPLAPLIACCCRWYSVPLVIAVTGDIVQSHRYAASPRWSVRVAGLVLGRMVRWMEQLSMLVRADLAFVYGDTAYRTYRRFARSLSLTREATIRRDEIVVRDTACRGPRIRVLQVASYSRNKNFPMLFRAVQRLLERGRDIEVHLAGDRAETEVAAAIDAAKRHPLFRDRVIEHGYLRKKELFALYQACDIATLTSHSEGWPRVLMESASFGLPIVTTAVGGIVTFIRDGDNGLLVPSDDDEAMSRAIERVITDEALRLRLVAAGYEMARANSREEVVAAWVREIARHVPDATRRGVGATKARETA